MSIIIIIPGRIVKMIKWASVWVASSLAVAPGLSLGKWGRNASPAVCRVYTSQWVFALEMTLKYSCMLIRKYDQQVGCLFEISEKGIQNWKMYGSIFRPLNPVYLEQHLENYSDLFLTAIHFNLLPGIIFWNSSYVVGLRLVSRHNPMTHLHALL